MHVLIVDDSRAMRLYIRRALRRMDVSATSVTEATDPMHAWRLMRSTTFDLVLSDWNMPKMTGLELLKRLRRSGVTTPFGFISVECSSTSSDAAREAGAEFLLNKPFSQSAFNAAITPLVPA
ncbi:MAG: two-component system chemotaxis response regulator CheY [Myxococcota bacterium]|jgi:two-component system chemotaxis response regulator CheY